VADGLVIGLRLATKNLLKVRRWLGLTSFEERIQFEQAVDLIISHEGRKSLLEVSSGGLNLLNGTTKHVAEHSCLLLRSESLGTRDEICLANVWCGVGEDVCCDTSDISDGDGRI